MVVNSHLTQIKPGFKQTEVGLIPLEWDVKQLGQIAKVVRGASPRPAGDPRYFNGTYIPWLTVAALTNVPDYQMRVRDTFGHLTEAGAMFSRTLDEETIILANSGATLGVAKVLAVRCCANDGIAALMDQRTCDNYFICYYLNSQTDRLRKVVATGNGQPNLNTTLIGALYIPLPPLREQHAISAALGDVDSSLASIDILVLKKRNIRQAAMQQLLTGKMRMAGFDISWKTAKLGNVVEIRKGQLITESMCVPGNVPVIAGGKKPAYFHNRPNRFGETITISASGASAGYVSFHETPIFASDCSTIEESNSYSLRYVYYQLLLLQEQIYNRQSGGAQPHVHPSDLASLDISFPDLSEQRVIAGILVDIDAEIAALEQRRDKTRAIKQGMMQELLSGRRRLV